MSFQQGLSGLSAAQRYLDLISNNVANSGTVGFKLALPRFADVYAAALGVGGGSRVGIGTTVSAVMQQFTQGSLTVTNNPLDVAINGNGFFRMSTNGTISYSRNGQFSLDKEGFIVNASGQRLTGYAADAQGQILSSSPVELSIDTADLTPKPTSLAELKLNLDSRASPPTVTPFDVDNPKSYSETTSVTVYDTLGNSHTLSLYFIKRGSPDDYSVITRLDGGTPQAAQNLDFNDSGALTTAMPLDLTFDITTGAATPFNFRLDLSGSTEYGEPFGVNKLTQDGYTSGRMSGVTIDADGIIQGRYSNGQSRNLGQILLASFTNPNGLQPLGNNQWAETGDSGQPLIGAPGSGSLGSVQSGAVEESNVDLTSELVNMITQQRAYQANAQSIRTQDQVLQTLVNLR